MAVIMWLRLQLNTFSGAGVLTSQAQHCPWGREGTGTVPLVGVGF